MLLILKRVTDNGVKYVSVKLGDTYKTFVNIGKTLGRTTCNLEEINDCVYEVEDTHLELKEPLGIDVVHVVGSLDKDGVLFIKDGSKFNCMIIKNSNGEACGVIFNQLKEN